MYQTLVIYFKIVNIRENSVVYISVLWSYIHDFGHLGVKNIGDIIDVETFRKCEEVYGCYHDSNYTYEFQLMSDGGTLAIVEGPHGRDQLAH